MITTCAPPFAEYTETAPPVPDPWLSMKVEFKMRSDSSSTRTLESRRRPRRPTAIDDQPVVTSDHCIDLRDARLDVIDAVADLIGGWVRGGVLIVAVVPHLEAVAIDIIRSNALVVDALRWRSFLRSGTRQSS